MSMIKQLRLNLILLASIGFLGIMSIPTYAAQSGELPERSMDFHSKTASLIAKAKSNGKISVIIRLKVRFTPEGNLSTDKSNNSSKVNVVSNSASRVGAQRNAIKYIGNNNTFAKSKKGWAVFLPTF